MGADIKLWANTGSYTSSAKTSESVAPDSLGSAPSSDVESIAGKVVKFLLTTKGSDVLRPTYGGTAMGTTQMAASYIPKFKLELSDDISACVSFIQTAEAKLADTVEKLANVVLVDVSYDTLGKSRIDVTIRVTTNFGNVAVVTVPAT